MKTSHRLPFLLVALLSCITTACVDEYLTTEPQTILTDEQVWSNPSMIEGVLADYYSRLPEYMGLSVGASAGGPMTSFDEAIYSGVTSNEGPNTFVSYPYGGWSLWDYSLIRDINLAIEKIEVAESPTLTSALKAGYIAELRFLRAWTYFQLVKRMGGVPIITTQLFYDFSGDPSYLQQPRATEAEVYDFIAGELDAIADQLGNAGSVRRANRYTALALKSRAMLYAGSLARHNNEMAAPITLPGGEVGIPAARAVEYYTKSLDASRAILTSGAYSLHRGNAHRGENFYEAVTMKSGNPETIFVRDYSATAGNTHFFTLSAIPRSMRIDQSVTTAGAAISPTLQLVEAFDYLDGSPGTMRGVGDGSNTAAGQANWIFYDNVEDIFAGKDARLYGTVIYPGASAIGQRVDLQAGVYAWNAETNKYDRFEGVRQSLFSDGGLLTGSDGPRGPAENYLSATGFYIRKYLDMNPAGGSVSVGSDVWWVRFRLAEIYLNAAEAAFELGMQGEALGYVNTIRERAGFQPNSLSLLTRERIRNERRVELAFEDHRPWDVIRWRIAHEIWDGSGSRTANAWVLFPYRVVRPGHPDHNKYVYDAFRAPRQVNPRFFQLGNYYSEIPATVRGNNPKIVPNPFH